MLALNLHCPPPAAPRRAAYTLNLRGDDIPYNPLFFAYLYVSAARAVLFIELAKIERPVAEYLQKLAVETRDYNDIWTFVRRREWGEGKVRRASVYPSLPSHRPADARARAGRHLPADVVRALAHAHALPLHGAPARRRRAARGQDGGRDPGPEARAPARRRVLRAHARVARGAPRGRVRGVRVGGRESAHGVQAQGEELYDARVREYIGVGAECM